VKLQRQVNNVLKSIVKRTKQIMFFCPPTRGSVHAVRSDIPLLYAFELLWLNGADLRNLPLIDRKKRLAALVKKSGCERIIYVQQIEREGSGSSRKFAHAIWRGSSRNVGEHCTARIARTGSRSRIDLIRRPREGSASVLATHRGASESVPVDI